MSRKARRRKAKAKSGITYTQHMYVENLMTGADQDDVLNVTVHHDANLVGIHYSISPVLTTAGNICRVELSDSGNFQGQTPDNPNTIFMAVFYAEGAQNIMANEWISNISIPFIAGDRIYVNCAGSDQKGVRISITLFWEQD